MEASKDMEKYFESIDEGVKAAYGAANEARKRQHDPEDTVDIPLAKDMAERVEGLISVVAPGLVGSGMTKRIHELEKQHGALAWEVALIIAEEVANERFCKFSDRKEAMEVGIRTGFAYHTVGIVAAPLEGFIGLEIKKTRGGKDYFAVKYAGPVRGAGGTGAAVSVLIADYIRKRMGYAPYDPTEDEVNRFITELQDYHERVTNLQYKPSEEEIRFLVKSIPVEIDGEPTERLEVSNYKDLPRVETNRIRSGVCLVLSMIALKAPKMWKRLSKWGKAFELDWGFLAEHLEIQKKKKAKAEGKSEKKVTPNYTFLEDLVAGRPVLTYPLRPGGFRLRYGRTRTTGFSAAGVHPATMHFLNRYIATGTQLKVERPGKAAAVTPCDTIDGPVVRLKSGDVLAIRRESDAKRLHKEVEALLFLGDILFNYGDFSENNHFLTPPGYCQEWWVQEMERATVNTFGTLDYDKLSELVGIPKEHLEQLVKNPQTTEISAAAAISLSKKLSIPLHPDYTYHWNGIAKEEFIALLDWMKLANIFRSGNHISKIVLPSRETKWALEKIGIPHTVTLNEFIILDRQHGTALLESLGISSEREAAARIAAVLPAEGSVLAMVNSISGVVIRDKSGTFIGCRMGRPEKAKQRKLAGGPQVLFPVGQEGGKLRSFQSAIERGKVRAEFPIYFCRKCEKETIYRVCESCNKKTRQLFHCRVCGSIETDTCPKHGPASSFRAQEIDINHHFGIARGLLKDKSYPELIKGVRGTSNKDHIPEHLLKGFLRAKHNIFVNKDGTTRYDMSELPLTHFRPKEIGTPVETLRLLGYVRDTHGKELERADQVLELKPQDVVLPNCANSADETAGQVLQRVANFVDELLVKLYGIKPFYNMSSEQDLVGCLVIGLAPHISAGTVGRIIGFSSTQGCYAHPLWHAALRRDCDGDECCVMLLMDALLNFSRQYLPDKRGSRTMDSPLVLTSRLVPSEVDDMVHGMDVVWKYPLKFYEAAVECRGTHDVSIEQLKKRLGTEGQYEGMGYTHEVSDINQGVTCSAYKTLPSMQEKLMGQMEIAERIRAVDQDDVARLVIEKHLLKDTKGNLRKFSMQQFRCVGCNQKFRRPPLLGKCTSCGGKIIFTVSEGSVVKYLEPSISLACKYNVSAYLKQSLELTKRRIEGVFGKEKERQEGLGKWFG
ncbi:MAG: DNA polymerase II large subunit [archaeon]